MRVYRYNEPFMRRLVLLSLLLAGCGGSSHHGSSGATPLLKVARSDGAAYGVGADGSPRLAAYDAKAKAVTVRSTSGSVVVPVAGTDLFGLAITGDYLLATVRENEVDGTQITDLRTQVSRFDAGEAPLLWNGGRVVWRSNPGFVVEELATGVRTTITLGANDGIVALRGERLLVANVPANYGDIRQATAYRTTDLAGAKIAEFALPPGDDYIEIDGLDATGRAVGRGETNGLVGFPFQAATTPYLWSADGVPTALPNSILADSLSLADDGTVFAVDEGERGYLLRGGAWRKLGVSGIPVAISPDGRAVFTLEGEKNGVAAYGVGS